MNNKMAAAKSAVEDQVGDLDHEDGLRWATQAGLIARGVVYVVFGIVAINLARGVKESSAASTQGAIGEMATGTGGKALLVIIGIALALYALACAVAAIRGTGGKKAGDSDTTHRLSDAATAVINASLAVSAFRAITKGRSKDTTGSGSSSQEKETASGVLGLPGGRFLVAVGALALIGWGVWQVRKVVKDKFQKGLDLASLSDRTRRAVLWLGRIGYCARAAAFALVGWFLLTAAWDHKGDKAVGVDGALRNLLHESHGPPILLAIGAGTIAFGLWSMVEGWFRREER